MHRLRVVTKEDKDFLFNLKKATLKEYIKETWGWVEIWQINYFLENFHPEDLKIISISGIDIGVLSVIEKEVELFLGLISILPEFQNQGIGSSLIRTILENGKLGNKNVKLQVLKVNLRAKTLYKKMGFKTTAENATHYFMEYIIK
ncbi:MAG: hypothetical protein CEE42_13810 [Promethearchaeota archaeon Loki_b31]|nr:MAG: hypothetical protein CEE42_13810 [Candidatus Lokiarchaeota archaeon Loki_b31]